MRRPLAASPWACKHGHGRHSPHVPCVLPSRQPLPRVPAKMARACSGPTPSARDPSPLHLCLAMV